MLLFFLGVQLAMGACIGIAVASGLMLVDAGGIGGLIKGAQEPWLPLAMLYIACALTFASVKTGLAVMLIPYPAGAREGRENSPEDDRPRE